MAAIVTQASTKKKSGQEIDLTIFECVSYKGSRQVLARPEGESAKFQRKADGESIRRGLTPRLE
jgi:hypothetical protein